MKGKQHAPFVVLTSKQKRRRQNGRDKAKLKKLRWAYKIFEILKNQRPKYMLASNAKSISFEKYSTTFFQPDICGCVAIFY